MLLKGKYKEWLLSNDLIEWLSMIAGSDGRILLIDDDCPTTFEQWKNSK